MIDYIKILNLSVNATEIENNPFLSDKWVIRSKDSEILEQRAELFGLTFQIKNENIKLSGSIHKYFNGGIHNHNDFTFSDIQQVIRELHQNYNIEPQNSRLNNVEFGVNVVLPLEPKVLLNNLISHRGEPFKREIEEGKIYYQCKHSQYIIKIYDKGSQYRLSSNLLRFEIKVLRMQFFDKKVNLIYLSDLLEQGIYPLLANILQSVFDEILFDDDSLNIKSLNATDREIYLQGSNPKTWIDKTPRTEREQKRLERLRIEFLRVLDSNRNGVDFVSITSELIKNKFIELSEIYRLTEQWKTKHSRETKSDIVGNLSLRYNVNLRPLLEKQKKGSKFISEKTLSENPQLCQKLNKGRRKNQRKNNGKTEAYYVAHNNRNDDSNYRNRVRYKIETLINSCGTQNFLFGNIEQHIKLNKEQVEALSFWNGTPYDILKRLKP